MMWPRLRTTLLCLLLVSPGCGGRASEGRGDGEIPSRMGRQGDASAPVEGGQSGAPLAQADPEGGGGGGLASGGSASAGGSASGGGTTGQGGTGNLGGSPAGGFGGAVSEEVPVSSHFDGCDHYGHVGPSLCDSIHECVRDIIGMVIYRTQCSVGETEVSCQCSSNNPGEMNPQISLERSNTADYCAAAERKCYGP